MSQIGVTGLAVMGANLARNIARRGVPIAVHNRTASKTQDFMSEYGSEGDFTACESLEEFVQALERPRRIIVMVKAGKPVDGVIADLVPLLDKDDIIIDAGNSHYVDTRRREEELTAKGLRFIGTGVSGGEEGALLGPSIMPGGPREAYAEVEEIFTTIAAQVDGEPCCVYIGPDGAGHYVKMVHNGIEYADMQLIAEAYDLLRHGIGLDVPAIKAIFDDWNTRRPRVLPDRDHRDGARQGRRRDRQAAGRRDRRPGRAEGHRPLDRAGRARAGRAADGHHRGGLRALAVSALRDQRRDAAGVLAGPKPGGLTESLVDDIRKALYASKVVAYAQGFEQMAAAAKTYDWDLKMGELAKIWRGGCIIRARFLNRITESYAEHPDLVNLLMAPYFQDAVATAQDAWRKVIVAAVEQGIAVPAFSSSLAYYDGYRRERGPANLIQGQRDFFGAHTYRRVDKEGSFHTRWSQDGTEVRTD